MSSAWTNSALKWGGLNILVQRLQKSLICPLFPHHSCYYLDHHDRVLLAQQDRPSLWLGDSHTGV